MMVLACFNVSCGMTGPPYELERGDMLRNP